MRTMSSRRRPFSDGSSIKDVHSEGGGQGVTSKVDKCGHGVGVFQLQWTIILTFVRVLLGNMAQKWATVTLFYGIMNLVLHSNFD